MAAFKAQCEQLKLFVTMCKANPAILHAPELEFYRDYLTSLGATLPTKSEEPKTEAPKCPKAPVPEPEVMEESDPESDLELDETGVIKPEEEEELPSGDHTAEVTDENMDASDAKRSEAMGAASEGRNEDAVRLFGEAISLNPASALLHSKRAALLVKMEKPLGAVRDCDKAIAINPDSAAAYKFRGRAYRLLGEWERAFKDLTVACKLDYDDVANEWLKEVEPNVLEAKKIAEHKRKQERKKEEKVVRERQERVRKAKEEYERKKSEAPSAGGEEEDDEEMGGMPGGMGGLFNDPDLMAAFQDPEVAAALADISANPANMAKWQSNPKVAKVMEKMAAKMGGMGMGGGGMGGMPGMGGMGGGFPGAAPGAAPSAPAPAPDCDVD